MFTSNGKVGVTLLLALSASAFLLPAASPPPAGPSAAPLAATLADAGSSPYDHGTSTIVLERGACVPPARILCQGMTRWEDGEFGVPASGRVQVVATWEAACLGCEAMDVYVSGHGNATGTSPLTLDLGTLDAGTYAVGVFFGGPVAGSARQDVQWEVLYG